MKARQKEVSFIRAERQRPAYWLGAPLYVAIIALAACSQVPPAERDMSGEPAGYATQAAGSGAPSSDEGKSEAEKAAERREAEKRAAELWAADQQAAEKRAAEKKAAEKKAAEKKAAEKKAAEKKAARKRAAEKRAAEKKAAEKKAAEKKAAEKKAAEKEIADKRLDEQKAAAEAPREVEPSTTAFTDVGGTTPQLGQDRAQLALAQPIGTRATAAPMPKSVKPVKRTGPRRQIAVEVEKLSVAGTQFEMVRLPGGRFQMGSDGGEYDEQPRHEVKLRPFLMGRYEVTQELWQSVMGSNPSYFADCADCPVDSVSWNAAQQFIEKLNQMSGKKFRLPSEAEWEYACRAGGDESYCGDSDETQVVWYAQNSEGRPQRVGQLAPNAFGLYDMSGNIYEWVADCWHSGYGGAPTDGQAWTNDACQRRVLRGGAWYYAPSYATATYRNANTPFSRFIIYGLRLAGDE